MHADECPDCGAVMVERTNKTTSETFWGCSQFPQCKGTRRIVDRIDDLDDLPSMRESRNDRRRWES